MTRILANDGIQDAGKQILEAAGIEVITNHIPQDELPQKLNEFDGILVRSATKVRQELIDQCPNLKLIGRGGVGMDNIDVEYARGKGLAVVNTPKASSQSVAELVFAHLFAGARYIHESNRNMPSKGQAEFKSLKKVYSKGFELSGKTLGIVGFGGIGQIVAKMAIGLGMNVVTTTRSQSPINLELDIMGAKQNVTIQPISQDELLKQSDFITLHVPFKSGQPAIIGADEMAKMKKGAVIINTARGGAVDETALLEALNSGQIGFAGIDVFENEPTPREDLLKHPNVSLTPHTGGSTPEAQTRVWIEMAETVVQHFS